MQVKTCTQCGSELPILMFYRDSKGKNGYRANCKKCMDENRKKYPENRDKENLKRWDRDRYQGRRKQDPRHRASILTNGAKKRAAEKGLEFDLDLNWVHEKLVIGVCEVSGLRFKFDYDYTLGGFGLGRAFAPSLDRVDPSKGYTKDNVNVVVWCYNAAKGVASHSEVLLLAEALVAANDNDRS